MSKSPKLKKKNYIFVLWGEYFDEVAATIFASALRRASLCVKIVGVHGPEAAGCHGVTLQSDISLGEALTFVNQALCLVLPCSTAAVKRMELDPRIHYFFSQARKNRAKFVVYDSSIIQQSLLSSLTIPPYEIATYCETENLLVFAHGVADALVHIEQAPVPALQTALDELVLTHWS
ncbi:MAG: hypothetical protein R3C14_21955 [Caldilineaceae bacterium]